MALVMCVVMMVGTTFAWFTDTASTGVNKIVAGNLKVDIVGADSEDHIEKLNFTKVAGAEGEALLWEPGCRYLTEGFRIANMGNLALKWKAEINKDNIVNGKVVDTAKDGVSLLDVIDFYVVTIGRRRNRNCGRNRGLHRQAGGEGWKAAMPITSRA